MEFTLEGVTVNGVPLKTHIKEAPVPEIREVIKENIYKPLRHNIKVKFQTRKERDGKVKIFTKEEISKIMEPISKPGLTDYIKRMLEVNTGITSTNVYYSYKEVDPTVTKKKVFQTMSTLAKRLGLTKTQSGKEKIYSLPQPEEPKAKEGFLPQVVRVEGKVDINININWR